MRAAGAGDTVRIHYTGALDDGTVFDSSLGRAPLEFTLGRGQVIPGFEAAVTGMRVAETKRVTIRPEQAYGMARDDMIMTLPRRQFPSGTAPQVGHRFQVGQGRNAVAVTVRAVDDEQVVLDANHPLAGRALTFELELVEIC